MVEGGGELITYDRRGNMLERRGPAGPTRYSWDTESRLVRVEKPDGSQVKYGYSPTGDRAWRWDKSGTTYFVTDGVNLLADLDQTLSMVTTYIHAPGIDRPVAMLRGAEIYFYHSRSLGTISTITDSQGKVAAAFQMDAFGNLVKSFGTVPNRFLFAAREYEQELGLYYYRARYYDPVLGRFLSSDPHWSSGTDPIGVNRYAYVFNSPQRYVDPTGMDVDPGGAVLGYPANPATVPDPSTLLSHPKDAAIGGFSNAGKPLYNIYNNAPQPRVYQVTDALIPEKAPGPNSRIEVKPDFGYSKKRGIIEVDAVRHYRGTELVHEDLLERGSYIDAPLEAVGDPNFDAAWDLPAAPPAAGSTPALARPPAPAPSGASTSIYPAERDWSGFTGRVGGYGSGVIVGANVWACLAEGHSYDDCGREVARNAAAAVAVDVGVTGGAALAGAGAAAVLGEGSLAGAGAVAGAEIAGAVLASPVVVTGAVAVGGYYAFRRLADQLTQPVEQAEGQLQGLQPRAAPDQSDYQAKLTSFVDSETAALDQLSKAVTEQCAKAQANLAAVRGASWHASDATSHQQNRFHDIDNKIAACKQTVQSAADNIEALKKNAESLRASLQQNLANAQAAAAACTSQADVTALNGMLDSCTGISQSIAKNAANAAAARSAAVARVEALQSEIAASADQAVTATDTGGVKRLADSVRAGFDQAAALKVQYQSRLAALQAQVRALAGAMPSGADAAQNYLSGKLATLTPPDCQPPDGYQQLLDQAFNGDRVNEMLDAQNAADAARAKAEECSANGLAGAVSEVEAASGLAAQDLGASAALSADCQQRLSSKSEFTSRGSSDESTQPENTDTTTASNEWMNDVFASEQAAAAAAAAMQNFTVPAEAPMPSRPQASGAMRALSVLNTFLGVVSQMQGMRAATMPTNAQPYMGLMQKTQQQMMQRGNQQQADSMSNVLNYYRQYQKALPSSSTKTPNTTTIKDFQTYVKKQATAPTTTVQPSASDFNFKLPPLGPGCNLPTGTMIGYTGDELRKMGCADFSKPIGEPTKK